jgi:hypothetical protein
LRKQQARAAALQSELEALQQDLVTSSAKEQDAFESLAKAECSQICNRVMTQLPRELRDLVYRHLSTTSEKRIDREYFRSTMDPKTKLHIYDYARWKTIHHPENFWDVEYVGNDFFQEFAGSYYHTSTFVFGDDEGLIERFLETDPLMLGYTPKELVSEIEIHLSAITYDRSSCIGYMFGCAIKTERLQTALKGLERLRSGASICVHFSTQANDEKQREEQVLTACTVLIPSLREAIVAGYEVRLVIDRKMEVGLDDASGDYQLKSVEMSKQ